MCGIAGFFDTTKRCDANNLKQMTDLLHHRGPDDSGYFFDATAHGHLGLGHRRLSILDLTAHGHQPMQFGNIRIVYNGEVYNFRQIRAELEAAGYRFDSDSDTEVVLKAYHRWGIEAVHRFNGMFAVAILDYDQEKLWLVRDRAGVKPLYWYHHAGLFLFASELKSFHQIPWFQKTIDTDALSLYLAQQYIPEPHTIFRHTQKLQAGHILEYDFTRDTIGCSRYWDIVEFANRPKLDISEEDAIAETEQRMQKAFAYRMVADVPVGIFLSGGYDSSIVTALLQRESSRKIRTFTIGFHERGFDEAPFARSVAEYLDTDHTEYYCTREDAEAIIPLLPEIYDEPFADSSAIPTLLVSRLAREKVTVALSADGGDELFAGYDNYTTTLRFYGRLPHPIAKTISALMRKIDPNHIPLLRDTYNFATRYEKIADIFAAEDIVEAMASAGAYMSDSEIRRMLRNPFDLPETNFSAHQPFAADTDPLSRMLAVDAKTYMVDDILTKVDRATMSVSLEGREPLLDYELIEFVTQLPSHYKYRDGTKKYLLKKIAHKYLPEKLMDRPKMGFNVPLYDWFQDALKHYFLHYLDRERLRREGIFDADHVTWLRDRYLGGEKENVEKLWTILMFEMWYEKWM